MGEALATDPVVDYSGNGNDGTPRGTTVVDSPFHAGKKARSLTDNDQIALENDFSLFPTAAISATVAVKITKNSIGYPILLGSFTNDGWHIFLNNNNQPYLFISINSEVNYIAFTTLTVNVPRTLGFNYNGTKVTLYNNGVSGNSWTKSGTIDYASETGYLGNVNGDTTGLIVGAQQIFSSSLSDTQHLECATNYPDPSLEAGKVLVRKWVYPEPSITNIAKSYGVSYVIVTHDLGSLITPNATVTITDTENTKSFTINSLTGYNPWSIFYDGIGYNAQSIFTVNNDHASHTLYVVSQYIGIAAITIDYTNIIFFIILIVINIAIWFYNKIPIIHIPIGLFTTFIALIYFLPIINIMFTIILILVSIITIFIRAIK